MFELYPDNPVTNLIFLSLSSELRSEAGEGGTINEYFDNGTKNIYNISSIGSRIWQIKGTASNLNSQQLSIECTRSLEWLVTEGIIKSFSLLEPTINNFTINQIIDIIYLDNTKEQLQININ